MRRARRETRIRPDFDGPDATSGLSKSDNTDIFRGFFGRRHRLSVTSDVQDVGRKWQNVAKLLPEVGVLEILCPKLGRRGLSSRALNVPSKHDQKIQKNSSDTLQGLNYMMT